MTDMKPTDMTPEQAISRDLRDRLGRTVIEDDGAAEDNLAIVLAGYFESHPDRPSDDPIDDELGWGEWTIEKSNKALELIARAALSRPAVPAGWKVHAKVNLPADEDGQRIVGYRVTLPDDMPLAVALDCLPSLTATPTAEESSGDGDTVTIPRAVYDMLAKKAGIEPDETLSLSGKSAEGDSE